MKIANIACAWPPYAGGMAKAAHQISNMLASKYEVENFTPTHLHPWLKYGHGAIMPQLLWRLRGFDYIYLHYPFFGSAEMIYLFKLFNKNKTKLIIHYHMDVKYSSIITRLLSLPERLIRRALFNQADQIVSASLDYIKNGKLKKYYKKYPDKFQEIPFGLDLQKFKPKLINRPAENQIIAQAQKIIHYVNDNFIKRQRLNLLFVGGLDQAHYFKGVPVLLEALAGINPERWRLQIIGEGNNKKTYEQMTSDLGLADYVKFSGHSSDEELLRSYQNSDLLILPSINNNEAFGLVLIEAMACGVPVIASDLPGVRRVFDNYQEGLLIEPGDVLDLRKKIELILNREDLRKEMARAARLLAEKKYDQDIMHKNILNLFDSTPTPTPTVNH